MLSCNTGIVSVAQTLSALEGSGIIQGLKIFDLELITVSDNYKQG